MRARSAGARRAGAFCGVLWETHYVSRAGAGDALCFAGRAGAVRGACGRGGWRARLANAFLRARRFVCLRKMQRATRGGRLAGGRGGRRAVSCGVARTVSCKALAKAYPDKVAFFRAWAEGIAEDLKRAQEQEAEENKEEAEG